MCIIFILQSLFRRIASILQKMIDCRDVTEGTTAYEGTQERLQIARRGCGDGDVYICRSRSVHGRRA